MRNFFMRVLVVVSILVALHGCMIQPADEGLSQEEVSTEEIVARPPYTCFLPIETGPCRAYFDRYAFDPETGRCVHFIYGGCGGNANNFESYGECRHRCGRFESRSERP